MVKGRVLVVIIALVWVLGGCGGPQEEATAPATPLPTATPVPTGAPVASWIEFTSEEGGFAVLMPSEPEQQTMAAPANDVAEQYMFTARYGEMVTLGVAYTDLPEDVSAVDSENLESLMAQVRDGALALLGAALVAEESISLDGVPGRQIEFELPEEQFPGGGEGVLRFYLAGSRAYQVLVLGPKGQLPAEEVDRFLDSFRLLEAPAPPAVALGRRPTTAYL